MGANKERALLKTAYMVGSSPSKTWSDKVDKMSDNQVIAVLRRFQSQNKL